MGPQHCCCGNSLGLHQRGSGHAASMGPQHCCCGNVCPGGPANLRVYCFNGAAALLLRKWRQFACSPSTGPGFNGAAALLLRKSRDIPTVEDAEAALQWGRSIAAAEMLATVVLISGQHCFNGAAALLLRKCRQRHDATESHFASMGPQHCCCGNRSGAVTRREAAPASMGPQHCCCGNPTRRGLSARLSPLQWGRSIAAAEICWTASLNRCYSQLQWGRSIAAAEIYPHISYCWIEQASMGPQHCCCGNAPLFEQEISEGELQWGRSIAAAEIR